MTLSKTIHGPIDLSANNRTIGTCCYWAIEVSWIPQAVKQDDETSLELLKQLLLWEASLNDTKKLVSHILSANYPLDAYSQKREGINGLIRTEQLVTISTINQETWEIEYICRSRPEEIWVNTPWKLDPGVLSHGWIDQAGVVNAWRYVADKLGKNDNTLTPEEYENYLSNNPFPENTSIVTAGHFILANGSNARNKWKDPEKYTQRTSWLFTVRTAVMQSVDYNEIIERQKVQSNIDYTSVSLAQWTDTSDFSPKHWAVHDLLSGILNQIDALLGD